MLASLEDLIAIQPYSGWRNSGSSGEREAITYVAAALGEMAFLGGLGMEVTSQDFNVLTGVEIGESQLILTIDGQPVEIAADALRGPRWNLKRAIRFDSDGTFNDADPNPVVVESDEVVVALDQNALWSVANQDLTGKIVLVNYAAVDRSILGTQTAVENAWALAAATWRVVLVTQYPTCWESHGAFVGDENAFNWVETPNNPPVLYARIEDMGEAGITGWDDLAAVEGARMVWDVDVFSPGTSGNLIARIPGQDSSQAVILGGHIDSPNSPGALDDGSGSAVLLEVARVINEAQIQPATDVYLVWYGSEETGLYGSAYFVMTHQEVLDRRWRCSPTA
jgi:hypothetical protein